MVVLRFRVTHSTTPRILVRFLITPTRSSDLHLHAAGLNDDRKMTRAEKEPLLIALFAEQGITLTFED
jgi:hypothetical protein